MKATDTVSTRLWKLAQAIAEQVRKHQSSGGITQTREMYVKPKFTQFEFRDGRIASQSWEMEYLEKSEWHWKDAYNFLDTVVKKLPEYADTFKLISKSFGIREGQAEFWLSRFAQAVSRMSLEKIGDEELVDLVTTFVSDLNGSPKDWHITAWLNGLWTVEEELTISDEIVIRHPRVSDFAVERRLEDAIYSPPFGMDFFHPFASPSAILEIRKRAKGQPELAPDLEMLLNLLRLYRVGSVLTLRVHWSAKSLTEFGSLTSTSGMGPTLPPEKYSLSTEDLEGLRTFIQKVKPVLTAELGKGADAADFMLPAIQRYFDAILKPESAESRISFAMMCLESLYLKSMERGELEHRLGQRVARILGTIGENPLEVFNTLKRAYDLRSKFVHGEPLQKEDRQGAPDILKKVLEYARASLVMFLQIKEKMDMDQFLSLIDKSLLSPDAQAKLDERMKELCTVH